MYVLVAYDISMVDGSGEARLRRVSKLCVQYGQRVQNSVFECFVDPAQYEALKYEIGKVINGSSDSVVFYNLGKNWNRRVERIGRSDVYDPQGPLLI